MSDDLCEVVHYLKRLGQEGPDDALFALLERGPDSFPL